MPVAERRFAARQAHRPARVVRGSGARRSAVLIHGRKVRRARCKCASTAFPRRECAASMRAKSMGGAIMAEAAHADVATGWRAMLPEGRQALHRSRADRRLLPRRVVGLSLCDDRRDADHAAGAGRDRQEEHHRLQPRLPRLQSQIPVGVGRRRRAAADPRPARPARVVAARRGRAGHRRGRQSRVRRSVGEPAARRLMRRSWSASPARPSTSSSTPIGSRSSKPRQLGVGSGMAQYGWRIGSVAAGALALVLAARVGWEMAYLACAAFALPAMLTGLVVRRARAPPRAARSGAGIGEAVGAV